MDRSLSDYPSTSQAGGGPSRRDGVYGWRMVFLCAVTYMMTAPGQTIGISGFIDPMLESLELTRTEISTAYMIGTLVSAGLMPNVGTLIDRLGSRTSIALSGGLLGVVSVAMAGVTGLVALTLGFVATRLFGQGSLNLSASNAVAPWFEHRRGVALGVSTAVGAALIALVPVATAAAIEDYGWRTSWVLLGVAVWLVVLPIAFFGIVNHPRDLGQRPDGEAPAPDQGAVEAKRLARSYTRGEALRTPMYWAIVAATGTSSAIATGLNFHQIDILGEQGLSRIEAAANYLPQTVGTLAATLVVGALVDKVRQRWIIVINMAVLCGVMLMVPFVQPGLLAVFYGLILGTTGGSNRMLETGATPKLFGLRHLGAIRGVSRVVAVAGSAVGPVMISIGRDLTGSYQAVLTWLLVVPIAVAALALVTPAPNPVPPSQR